MCRYFQQLVLVSALAAVHTAWALSPDGAVSSPSKPSSSVAPSSRPAQPAAGGKPILQNPSVEDVKKSLGKNLFKGPKTKDVASAKAAGFGVLVQFATDSSEVIPTPNLETILAALMDLEPNASIQVTGHTDNVGNDAYNMDLSRNRAEAVRRWFETKGVRPGAVRTRGAGFHEPADTNATEAGRQRNRRVEFTGIYE